MIAKLLFAVALGSASLAASACPTDADAEVDFTSALTVKLGSLEVSQDDGRRNVASLGTINNASTGCFEEVVVEVKYFDTTHTLVDTVVQPLYGVVVPPKSEVAFRVLDAAAKAKEAYATQEARLLSAEPRYSRHKSKPTLGSTLGELLVSWGPMILLIAVWIYFMRRMRRKDSPQERSIALLQQQVDLSKANGQSVERIATALEAISEARRDS